MKKRLVCFALALFVLVSALPLTSFAKLSVVDEKEYDQIGQTFTPLDLRNVVTMGFADDFEGDGVGGWTDQGPLNDLSDFDLRGSVKLKGVEFNIIDPNKNNGKSVITLRGENLETLPTSVDIPVGQKAAGVYFLHAATWAVVKDIATYTFVYDDGSEYAVPIQSGKENFNFWGAKSSDKCIVAWSGKNKSTSIVSLYLFAMENPYPDKVISKITCATKGSGAFCMIVAATLTDNGPYLMQEPDTANPDTSDWYAYEMPTYDTITGTALDASFVLDGPAGKHGYLNWKDGRLQFDDGTDAKFWGINVTEIPFDGYDRIDWHADRLASHGFNLVRMHFYQMIQLGSRGLFNGRRSGVEIDMTAFDKMCYFISKLKEKGIYVYLDLLASHQFVEDENIRGYSRNKSSGAPGSVFYFDEEMQQMDESYIRQILGTKNPYTGITLGEDPAVAFVDFKNENTFLGAKRAEFQLYDADIRKLYCDWLKEKYGTDENLRKAWTYLGKQGLDEGESMFDSSVVFGYYGELNKYVRPRYEDNLQFMADVTTEFWNRNKKLIDELGFKGIATTCTLWGADSPPLMYTLTDSQAIDSHVYWSHPGVNNLMQAGTAIGWNKPVSMLETANFGYFSDLFNSSVYDMPYTITEWDECDLNPTMAEGYTLMAAYSSMHNWVPMNYAYGGQPDDVTGILTREGPRTNLYNDTYRADPNLIRNYWSLKNNPVKMGCITAASIMRLRGDVKEADKGFYSRYSQNDYFNPAESSLSKDPYIGMIGKSGVAYDKKTYDEGINDDDVLYKAYMSKKLGIPCVSDTGEIRTDLTNHTFEVNTSRSQAVVGRITDKEFETDDMKVTVENPFANIVLTSLTDEPIYSSDRLLITAVGDQRNTDEVRSRDGMYITRGGEAPVLVEPIKGRLTLKTKDDVTVYRIGSTGERIGTARVEKDGNGYSVLCMRADDTCMNYEVVRTAEGAQRNANEHIVYERLEVKPLFDDLAGYEWAQKAITRDVITGYMTGISENEFAPGANITRGDFIASVISACKIIEKADDSFADVSDSDENKNSIGVAKKYGIANGDENGNFNPDSAVTLADAYTLLNRAATVGNTSKKAEDCFNRLFPNGFDGNEKLTRAQTASLIYTLLWE